MNRLASLYDCYFEPETLASIRDLLGEDSKAYELARQGAAGALKNQLDRNSWPRTFFIEPELAETIIKDPTVLATMVDTAKKVTELAKVVDQEWLRKCPIEGHTRAAQKQRIKREARNAD